MNNSQVPDAQKQIVPLLLCGGAGLRLRPLTTPARPKAFLTLVEQGPTLLQITAARTLRVTGCDARRLMAVTLDELGDETVRQLEATSPGAGLHVVRETAARNTAAAIDVAVARAAEAFGPETVLWIAPIDHSIGDESALRAALADALPGVRSGHLVIFGIRPAAPETGYGYIRQGERLGRTMFLADGFQEKPDMITARHYMNEGTYLWNSGMVLATARDLRAALDAHGFQEGQSFDRAVLEKARNVAVVPCDPQWSDIGTHENFASARSRPS